MMATLGWYVVVSGLGWLVWPLAFRLLPGLPDRGYTLSRALALLLVSYVFWLLGVLGLVQNTIGSILLAIIIVLSVGLWINTTHPDRTSLGAWIQTHGRLILVAELVFLVAFAGWAFVRAYNPEISGTEKPMELAFLNGVRRSPTFPPQDPWLSGYAISYYYFGYVIIVMLAQLTGVATSVAFNLGIALLFALTLLGGYGLVYNLVVAHRAHIKPGIEPRQPLFGALLGPLMLGVMGNLGGALELLWALNVPGARFWRWLDVLDLNEPAGRVFMPPGTWRFWWWWRASRVIHDRDAAGVSIGLQPIDEFPQFSFLLGDMHPHVLALPFVLLALALAFNALAEHKPQTGRFAGVQVGLYALCFGGLAFLNTWDLPIYLFVLVGALVVRRIRQRGYFDSNDVWMPVVKAAALLVIGLVAYLPWLVSFSSQAGGVLPNAIFATRLHQFVVMFGPLLLVVTWYVLDEALRRRSRADWGLGALLGGGLLAGLIALAAALSFAAIRTDTNAQAFAAASAGLPAEGAPEAIQALVPQAARTILRYRLAHPLTPLVLAALVGLGLVALLPRPVPDDQDDLQTRYSQRAPLSASAGFALLLIVTGALLTLGPEFVYLRDNFGQRLNTIFKFYYAAWIVWSIAAAFAAHVLVARLRLVPRVVFGLVTATLVAAGLVYPVLAIPAKTGYFSRLAGQPPTLDGIDYIRVQSPADYAALAWLAHNAEPGAVVLEAVGGAYSYYGRVSSATGIPTVMGWPNHERQWRGPHYDELAGTREQDVHIIYDTPNVDLARDLLRRYGVSYVFVGSLETSPGYASPNGLAKFERFLTVVYRGEGATIYRTDLPPGEEQP